MPPEEEELHLPRVSEADLLILKDWILGGAPSFASADAAAADPAAPAHSDLAAAAKAIFRQRCYQCHKFDVAKGGIKIMHHRLLVTVRKVVVPGQPENSELFQLLTTEDEDVRMPPATEYPAPARRRNRDHSQVDPRRGAAVSEGMSRPERAPHGDCDERFDERSLFTRWKSTFEQEILAQHHSVTVR